MSTSKKLNDLSSSILRKRYFDSAKTINNRLTMIITRSSTKKQERGKSFQEQHALIESYVKEKSLVVIKTETFSESAADHHMRKKFKEAIDQIKRSQSTDKPIHNLVFAYQSRSSRNKASRQELESLLDLGVTLHFARDKRVLSAHSELPEFMIWYMEDFRNAQFIKDLKLNVVGGIIQSIEDGMAPIGRPPYGYKSVGKKDNRHFEFNGLRADYMLEAFRLMATGFYQAQSYKKLKAELDAQFVELKDTPKAKKLGSLLRNPFYCGDFYYANELHLGDSKRHPSLISKIMWNQVQEILDGKRKTRTGEKGLPYLQLMRCSGKILDDNGNLTNEICGCSITGEEKRKKRKDGSIKYFYYYHCSNTVKRCSQRDVLYMKEIKGKVNYSQEEIEKLLEPIFDSFSVTSEIAHKMKSLLWEEHFIEAQSVEKIGGELRAKLGQIQTKMDRAYEDKLNGELSSEMWNKKRSEWEKEKSELEVRLSTLGSSNASDVKRGVDLIELIQHVGIIYKNASPETKRRMLDLVSSNHELRRNPYLSRTIIAISIHREQFSWYHLNI